MFESSNGETIACKTVYTLLHALTSDYPTDKVEKITGISQDKIKAAAQMFATNTPASWYAWNGIEQNINAMQTNRAVNILYALTGSYDTPGGNVILKGPASNLIIGHDLMAPSMADKRLGFKERPLGPCSRSGSVTQAYEVYQAILTGKPYPVKAMIGFGGNIVMSNAPSRLAKKALSQLDFHVQTELFLSPTAQLADMVLPAASSWESWHVGAFIAPLGDKGYIRLRPEVVPPQYECRSDMEIMFKLSKRLGFGNHFWDGNVEAGFNYQFSPSGITVADLRNTPEGICLDLNMEYQKYAKVDKEGHFRGFPSPSKRVEIYSSVFKDHGYDPLPSWTNPLSQQSRKIDAKEKFPLLLTSGKLIEYCHSQHRALSSLRKRVPHPYLDINPDKAAELGITDGEWVQVKTSFASITLKAQFNDGIANDVVSTQNGWWQRCSELNLPGYDPYAAEGANINLLFDTEERDPISGSLCLKGYPCNVRKIT
jgi:anaerobic selenocysteine-containing dehydrogenase